MIIDLSYLGKRSFAALKVENEEASSDEEDRWAGLEIDEDDDVVVIDDTDDEAEGETDREMFGEDMR